MNTKAEAITADTIVFIDGGDYAFTLKQIHEMDPEKLYKFLEFAMRMEYEAGQRRGWNAHLEQMRS